MGLSLTDCKGDDPDPIVGDWTAVKVDMEKYPMVGDGPDNLRLGVVMHIEADLIGELEMYGVYSYDEEELSTRSEYGLGLTVEVQTAPTYRIVVRGFEDFIGGGDVYYSEDGYSESGGYGETGYADGGYDATSSADTGGSETGALGGAPQQAGDRGVRRSTAADKVLTLSCTLADDALECTNADKSDTEAFQTLSFVRKTPESN